jgi:hypothetical protein
MKQKRLPKWAGLLIAIVAVSIGSMLGKVFRATFIQKGSAPGTMLAEPRRQAESSDSVSPDSPNPSQKQSGEDSIQRAMQAAEKAKAGFEKAGAP